MLAAPKLQSEESRKEVFAALVEAQDKGFSVNDSRRVVAGYFSLTIKDVERVEREGLEKSWPPLE